MSRVFITGMGITSCLGWDINEFWNNLLNEEIIHRDALALPLELPKVLRTNIARRMDRFSYMTLFTAKMAYTMRGLETITYDPFRVGTILSTGYGPINNNIAYARKLLKDGANLVSPTMFANTVYNACVGHTCINLNLKGVSTMLMGGNHIGYSIDLLNSQKGDIILTGATEEYCNELVQCFNKKDYTASGHSENLCKPFDKNRDGTNITEGSAVIVLEREDHALFESDKRICEVNGSGTSYSPYNPVFAKEEFENKALIISMKQALEEANLKEEEIDGVFAAANGNIFGDRAEAIAIKEVFPHTCKSLPVTSIKGALGETLSSSFAINVITAALALKNKVLPKTFGFREAEKDLEIPILSHNTPGNYKHILVNGYDIGGNMHSVVLSAC